MGGGRGEKRKGQGEERRWTRAGGTGPHRHTHNTGAPHTVTVTFLWSAGGIALDTEKPLLRLGTHLVGGRHFGAGCQPVAHRAAIPCAVQPCPLQLAREQAAPLIQASL